MRKILLLLYCMYAGNLVAQVLHVAPGTDFFVKAGTVLHLDSLVLTPSADFVLNGNTFTRDANITQPALSTVHISRVYHFSNLTAPFQGSVLFYYRDGAELNGLPESDLRLHIHDGTMWNRYNSNFTNDAVANNVLTTSVGAVMLNEITLASSASVLPVTWIDVTAARNYKTVQINWSVMQGLNTAYFIIEKSANSQQWSRVGTPVTARQGAGANLYSSTDFQYDARIIYYRIKQVDENGKTSYSSITKVPAENSLSQMSVYPSPVASQFYVNNATASQLKEVQVLDVNGSMVAAWKNVQASYNIQQLPAGTYNVRLVCKDGTTQTLKITKL